MKLFGRLGWFGQCACCNGPRCKRCVKQIEEREWRRDAGIEGFRIHCSCGEPMRSVDSKFVPQHVIGEGGPLPAAVGNKIFVACPNCEPEEFEEKRK